MLNSHNQQIRHQEAKKTLQIAAISRSTVQLQGSDIIYERPKPANSLAAKKNLRGLACCS